jgi:hypothetical protein
MAGGRGGAQHTGTPAQGGYLSLKAEESKYAGHSYGARRGVCVCVCLHVCVRVCVCYNVCGAAHTGQLRSCALRSRQVNPDQGFVLCCSQSLHRELHWAGIAVLDPQSQEEVMTIRRDEHRKAHPSHCATQLPRLCFPCQQLTWHTLLHTLLLAAFLRLWFQALNLLKMLLWVEPCCASHCTSRDLL